MTRQPTHPPPGTRKPKPPPPPKGPPLRWRKPFDPNSWDVITDDWRADREIAIRRGLYPLPLWRKVKRALLSHRRRDTGVR